MVSVVAPPIRPWPGGSTSFANLMTHQVPPLLRVLFLCFRVVLFSGRTCGRTDGRTTTRENNDQPYGRGLVDQLYTNRVPYIWISAILRFKLNG